MEAIVLAGGYGTRLKSIFPDQQKVMLHISGKPFLCYLLENLIKNNFSRVILSVGYKKDSVKNYFGSNFNGLNIDYSEELKALGTGGAIKKSLELSVNKKIFIFNGDTFFNFNKNDILQIQKLENELVVVGKKIALNDRYGSIYLDNENYIIKFLEKVASKNSIVSTGCYCLRKDIFQNYEKDIFSFEEDFIPNFLESHSIKCWITESEFLDIGIPSDFYKARSFLKV